MSKFTKTIAGFAGSIALIASLAGSASAATFNTNLTVGSTGADVSALQAWLVSKGHLVMPSGVSMGYFGSLTKAAVAAYQTAKGISPAVGYFGPITRAAVNADAGGSVSTVPGCVAGAMYSTTTGAPCAGSVSTVPGCSAGAMYSSTTGASCSTGSTSTSGTGITTPGVEGTLSVTESSSGIKSTVYEGDTMAPILGLKIEAKNSDISIQRIKLDMDESTGSDTKFYNKIFKKIYVTDESGNVLASSDLNSSTVIKDGSDYFITLAGFNYVVSKGASKVLVIKADLYSSIDSADYDFETYTIAVAANGVRGIDGAGIDQYAGSTSIANTPTLSATLADSATLKISLNSSSPKKSEVVATGAATEDEIDNLPVLIFDAKAEKDNVTITDLNIGIAKSGTGAAIASSTVRLWDGATELDATTVAGGDTAVFSDLDLVISKDTTKTLKVTVDVRDANSTVANFVATASSTGITDENSNGDSVTTSGTATGYSIGVRNTGLEIRLISKSITTGSAPQTSGSNNISTSTLTATFNVGVKALGGDVLLGTAASTTYPFFEDGGASPSFTVYRNGAVDATISSYATSTSFTIPSQCTSNGTNSCLLTEGSAEVTFPITVQLLGRSSSAALTNGLYAIQYANASWISSGTVSTATFMNDEQDWRTADISFP